MLKVERNRVSGVGIGEREPPMQGQTAERHEQGESLLGFELDPSKAEAIDLPVGVDRVGDPIPGALIQRLSEPGGNPQVEGGLIPDEGRLDGHPGSLGLVESVLDARQTRRTAAPYLGPESLHPPTDCQPRHRAEGRDRADDGFPQPVIGVSDQPRDVRSKKVQPGQVAHSPVDLRSGTPAAVSRAQLAAPGTSHGDGTRGPSLPGAPGAPGKLQAGTEAATRRDLTDHRMQGPVIRIADRAQHALHDGGKRRLGGTSSRCRRFPLLGNERARRDEGERCRPDLVNELHEGGTNSNHPRTPTASDVAVTVLTTMLYDSYLIFGISS